MPEGTLWNLPLDKGGVKKIGEQKMPPAEAAIRIKNRLKNAEAQLYDAFAVLDLMIKDYKVGVEYYVGEANSYFNGMTDSLQRAVDALEKEAGK
jgi:hypothetical protein